LHTESSVMNKVILGDCVEELTKLNDFSVDLVVADPPYWKVVNEKWDYQWKTEQEYIQWSITCIKEVVRTLRYGRTFYLFGYFRTLAHLVRDSTAISAIQLDRNFITIDSDENYYNEVLNRVEDTLNQPTNLIKLKKYDSEKDIK